MRVATRIGPIVGFAALATAPNGAAAQAVEVLLGRAWDLSAAVAAGSPDLVVASDEMDAFRRAMVQEMVQGVDFELYVLDLPAGWEDAANRLSCQQVDPTATRNDQGEREAEEIARKLDLMSAQLPAVTTRCFASAQPAEPPAEPEFQRGCEEALAARGLEVTPFAEAGSRPGAIGRGSVPAGDATVVWAECALDGGGNVEVTLVMLADGGPTPEPAP